jgi:hypothetical protein
MKYPTYQYLYPPRPETAVAPNTLKLYEDRGWVAQAKMNGTCCTIYVPSITEGPSFAMGRHGPDNELQWQPGNRWQEFQQHLPGKGWYVFVGELLHSKGVGVRDTIYLHDLLVDDGEYLIGKTYADRYECLSRLCAGGLNMYEDTHTIVFPGVWLAANHDGFFQDWYNEINGMSGNTAIEGLVFKNPTAKLRPCTARGNANGQYKCRRTTRNLSF